MKAFAGDPSSSSRNYLGEKDSGEKDANVKSFQGEDAKGTDPKGKDPDGKETKGKYPKGKEAKGKGRKGKSESDYEEEKEEEAGRHYTSYSIRGKWAPINRIDGRQYREYRNSRYDWVRIDAEWREARDPTGGIDDIEGDTKK